MRGPQFFQTNMGRIFFEGTVPRLYRAIDRLADALAGPRGYRVVSVKNDDEQTQAVLDELGREGWRLTHVEGGRMFLERVIRRKERS